MPARPLLAFRLAFASIWLVYDVLDLAGLSTAHLSDWVAKSAPPELVALQAGLIASQLGLILLEDGGSTRSGWWLRCCEPASGTRT